VKSIPRTAIELFSLKMTERVSTIGAIVSTFSTPSM